MIDPRIDPQLRQSFIDVRAPRFPPVLQQLTSIPVAFLLSKADRPNLAHRQHDVRMRLRTTILGSIPMHIEVRDHPAIHKLALHEIAREQNSLIAAHLPWHREFDLPGKLRVLALLTCLHLVPERGAIL